MNTKISVIILSFFLISGLGSVNAKAQTTANKEKAATIFQLFEEGSELTLTTDLERLINNTSSEEYQPATLMLEDGQSFDLKVSLRGKFRRRVCGFPPISFKFSKDKLEEMGFDRHNKLKLVTHCIEDDKFVGNNNVMKEYLAYKIYQIINPNSYQVKYFKINYEDVNGAMKTIKRYGLLIEDTDEMAERLGGEECDECLNTAPTVISSIDEAKLSLFQYMIGNEDWSISLLRNVKLAQMPNGIRVPVPYDFDFSGLVNASYAIPNADYGLQTMRQRYYLGYPIDTTIMDQVIAEFKEKEEEILKVIRKCKPLNINQRVESIEYVQAFYDQLDDFYSIAPGVQMMGSVHSYSGQEDRK